MHHDGQHFSPEGYMVSIHADFITLGEEWGLFYSFQNNYSTIILPCLWAFKFFNTFCVLPSQGLIYYKLQCCIIIYPCCATAQQASDYSYLVLHRMSVCLPGKRMQLNNKPIYNYKKNTKKNTTTKKTTIDLTGLNGPLSYLYYNKLSLCGILPICNQLI